jgi:hypothetical protein
MILFLIKRNILKVMTEYLHHVQWYLKVRFDLPADILAYDRPPVVDKNKYTMIIFVQHVDVNVIRQFTAQTKPVQRLPPRRGNGPVVYPQSSPSSKKFKIFLLNTEQATMTRYTSQTINEIQQYKVAVIDYSLENIALLKKRLPHTTFIHFPFPFRVKPAIDKRTAVISLQSSAHRRQVCNGLKVPVANFFGKWGGARDTMIYNSKVLVNVHYSPGQYGIFESIRCYNALEMRTLVISEPSVDTNSVLLNDFIIFVPAGQMAAKLKDVLANYQTYYDKCFSDARLAEIERRFEQTYRHSLDVIMALPANY